MTIRLIDDRGVGDAAVLLADLGYAMVPVRPCPTCLDEQLPTDHRCEIARPFSAIERRLTADIQAATLNAITPPGSDTP